MLCYSCLKIQDLSFYILNSSLILLNQPYVFAMMFCMYEFVIFSDIILAYFAIVNNTLLKIAYYESS